MLKTRENQIQIKNNDLFFNYIKDNMIYYFNPPRGAPFFLDKKGGKKSRLQKKD